MNGRRRSGSLRVTVIALWLALVSTPAVRAAGKPPTSSGASDPRAAEADLSAPVIAEELRLITPGDIVGRNFSAPALLSFGGRTDRAAAAALAGLHPLHHLEVTIRYTLFPDKPHDVQLSFVPDEVSPPQVATLRDALLHVPTVKSARDEVSFTRTYGVRGSQEVKAAMNRPPRWGPSVPDPDTEASAAAAVGEIGAGTETEQFGRTLILGPSLYGSLGPPDSEARTLGIPFKILIPGPKGARMSEGRLYRGGEVAQLLRTASLRQVAQRFTKGRARPATAGERERFYDLISFEIEGMPVPVVQEGEDVLLIDFLQRKVLWMEIIPSRKR